MQNFKFDVIQCQCPRNISILDTLPGWHAISLRDHLICHHCDLAALDAEER